MLKRRIVLKNSQKTWIKAEKLFFESVDVCVLIINVLICVFGLVNPACGDVFKHLLSLTHAKFQVIVSCELF